MDRHEHRIWFGWWSVQQCRAKLGLLRAINATCLLAWAYKCNNRGRGLFSCLFCCVFPFPIWMRIITNYSSKSFYHFDYISYYLGFFFSLWFSGFLLFGCRGSPPRIPFSTWTPWPSNTSIQLIWIIQSRPGPVSSGTKYEKAHFPYKATRQGEFKPQNGKNCSIKFSRPTSIRDHLRLTREQLRELYFTHKFMSINCCT